MWAGTSLSVNDVLVLGEAGGASTGDIALIQPSAGLTPAARERQPLVGGRRHRQRPELGRRSQRHERHVSARIARSGGRSAGQPDPDRCRQPRQLGGPRQRQRGGRWHQHGHHRAQNIGFSIAITGGGPDRKLKRWRDLPRHPGARGLVDVNPDIPQEFKDQFKIRRNRARRRRVDPRRADGGIRYDVITEFDGEAVTKPPS